MTSIDRPTFIKDKHLEYLDKLQRSSITNMYGAGSYVQQTFGLSRKDANTLVHYWMESYLERHP